MPTINELDKIRDRLDDTMELLDEYRLGLLEVRAKEVESKKPRAKLIEVVDFQVEKVNDLIHLLETNALDELIWLYDVAHIIKVARSDAGLI